MKVKEILKYLLIVFTVFGSHAQKTTKNNDQTSVEDKYIPVRDGLYKDSKGNIYFKIIDNSDPNNPIERFNSIVYSTKFGTVGIKEIKYVIHTASFKRMNIVYYKDKNHVYCFHYMADGGTMGIVEEADAKTFETFKHSLYAVDSKSTFYNGYKIEVSDIVTFEPVFIGSEMRVGWYAKDKNHYYDGGKIMTEAAVQDLKDLMKELVKKN